MSLLDTPMRINHEAHRIYVYAPGEVCIDLTSGTQEDRERVMVLLVQVQEMTHALRPLANTQCEGWPTAADTEVVSVRRAALAPSSETRV